MMQFVHICVHVKMDYCVIIDCLQSDLFFDVFYSLCQCALRNTSEMADSVNDSVLSICIAVSSNSVSQELVTNRTSKHNRNIPSTGTDDFFMLNLTLRNQICQIRSQLIKSCHFDHLD